MLNNYHIRNQETKWMVWGSIIEKKKTMKKIFFTGILFFASFFFSSTFGQLTDMGRLLSGGAADGGKLAEAYLAPFPKAFGATLNAGWYNTARPHRFPGLDITLSFNVAAIPDDAKYFDLNDLDLSPSANISGSSITPTFSGNGPRPSLEYTETVNNEQITLAEYTMPQGTGIGFIPAPTLQLGVGLPFDTDFIIRFIPKVNIATHGNLGLWGIGIKHSLKQHIPVVRRLPLINFSAMAGYTKFYTGTNLNFVPAHINAVDNTSTMVSFDNQRMEFGVGSFTANLIASVDIPIITVYGSAGFNSTSTDLSMTGWYPVPVVNQDNPENLYTQVTDGSAIKDPVDFRMGNDFRGIQPRLTAGFKLKLTVLHIHADYTYARYSVFTGGIGISIR